MRASIFSRRKSKAPTKETNTNTDTGTSERKTERIPTLGPLHSVNQSGPFGAVSNKDEAVKPSTNKGYDVGGSHSRDGEYHASGAGNQRLSVVSPTYGNGNGNGGTHNVRSTSACGSVSYSDKDKGMISGIPGFRSRSVSPSKSPKSLQSRQSRIPSAQGHANAILSHALPPYSSASNSYTSLTESAAYLPLQQSWTNMAEDDLINNLGPRERTRQEVLWEIVSSEER
jgi:hypothetical protein